VEPGWRWLSLTLENVSTEPLTALDVQLNSVDTYNMRAVGTGSYIDRLDPGERRVEAFQIAANGTAGIYISVDGLRGSTHFHWESPTLLVTVGRQVANLVSFFAMTAPYPPLGEKILCEATIRGLSESSGLQLEFWAETPGGEFESLGEVETKPLAAAEEALYAVEFTPEEEGLYTLYAYLYDDIRRLGRETERVHVREG
jgi:hypothetical protein